MVYIYSLTGASIVGQIGTMTDEDVDLLPSENCNGFYLNTLDQANATGNISSLRYCYCLRDEDSKGCYQSTFAIYRQNTSDGIYTLAPPGVPFTIVVDVQDEIELEDDGILKLCRSLSIVPSVEVQSGDVIGACISRFSDDDDVHPLCFVADPRDSAYTSKYLQRRTANVQEFCGDGPGMVPRSVDLSDGFSESQSAALLIFGLISKFKIKE